MTTKLTDFEKEKLFMFLRIFVLIFNFFLFILQPIFNYSYSFDFFLIIVLFVLFYEQNFENRQIQSQLITLKKTIITLEINNMKTSKPPDFTIIHKN